MGKPVALEARAELRLTLGFISMMTLLPFLGSTAHWTFDPPVAMPIFSKTLMESSRIAWYSLSVSVMAGATVMESPVCTPMGSRFSMEQTMTALPALSRMTSISYSFQPIRDSSIKTSLLSEASKPAPAISKSSFSSWAMPPPVPPRVKAGLIIKGQVPISLATAFTSSRSWAQPLFGMSRSSSCMAFLKRSLSSARSMALSSAPIISTLYFFRTPDLANSMARFRAVWPPSVGNKASGLSFSMIFSTYSGSKGSM